MNTKGKSAKSVIWIKHERAMVANLPNFTKLRIIPHDSRSGDCIEAVIDLLTDSGSKVLKRLHYTLPVGVNGDDCGVARVLISRSQAYAAALYPELLGIAPNNMANPLEVWFQIEGDLLMELSDERILRISRDYLENGCLSRVKLERLSRRRGFENFELPAPIITQVGKVQADRIAERELVSCIQAYAADLLPLIRNSTF